MRQIRGDRGQFLSIPHEKTHLCWQTPLGHQLGKTHIFDTSIGLFCHQPRPLLACAIWSPIWKDTFAPHQRRVCVQEVSQRKKKKHQRRVCVQEVSERKNRMPKEAWASVKRGLGQCQKGPRMSVLVLRMPARKLACSLSRLVGTNITQPMC